MNGSHDHHHDDDGHAHHPEPLAPIEARVAAIESVLVEHGLFDTDQLDAIVANFEHTIGPLNGAKVVARAWIDPEYRTRLLADGTEAIAELGFGGPEGDHMVVVENTPEVHNLVVCTLCSCYPWPTLGLPPDVVQGPGVPVARGARAARVARRDGHARSPTTSRSGCGTPVPRSATSCCPERPAGTDGARRGGARRLASPATR